MFKDLFENTKRLVFQNRPEAPRGNEAEAAAAMEAAGASPSALQKEAKKLLSSIDDYANSISRDLRLEEKDTIDLNKPKTYKDIREPYASVIQSLLMAKRDIAKGASRVNLDTARIALASADAFYKSHELAGDPMSQYTARVSDVDRAKPPVKRAKEKQAAPESRFSKLARLMDSFRDLPDNAENQEERMKIGSQIIDILRGFKALKSGKYTVGDVALLVQAGKKPGQYMLVLGKKLDADSAATKYWERIFVGTKGHTAYAEDFAMNDSQLVAHFAKQKGRRLG